MPILLSVPRLISQKTQKLFPLYSLIYSPFHFKLNLNLYLADVLAIQWHFKKIFWNSVFLKRCTLLIFPQQKQQVGPEFTSFVSFICSIRSLTSTVNIFRRLGKRFAKLLCFCRYRYKKISDFFHCNVSHFTPSRDFLWWFPVLIYWAKTKSEVGAKAKKLQKYMFCLQKPGRIYNLYKPTTSARLLYAAQCFVWKSVRKMASTYHSYWYLDKNLIYIFVQITCSHKRDLEFLKNFLRYQKFDIFYGVAFWFLSCNHQHGYLKNQTVVTRKKPVDVAGKSVHIMAEVSRKFCSRCIYWEKFWFTVT